MLPSSKGEEGSVLAAVIAFVFGGIFRLIGHRLMIG
jgi:hypothetical protein